MKIIEIILAFFMAFVLATCGRETSFFDAHNHKREIGMHQLPEAVRENIQARFEGAVLVKVNEIIHHPGERSYDVEIALAHRTFDVMYDARGGYLGEEDDDDDE